MIIGLVALFHLFFGGVSEDAIREVMQANISDPQRVEAILEILDETQGVIDGYADQLEIVTRRVVETNANYGSADQEYAAVRKHARDAMIEARTKILDKRFEMKAQMTQAEWEAVFPAPE